jgi:hypothetical protein
MNHLQIVIRKVVSVIYIMPKKKYSSKFKHTGDMLASQALSSREAVTKVANKLILWETSADHEEQSRRINVACEFTTWNNVKPKLYITDCNLHVVSY